MADCDYDTVNRLLRTVLNNDGRKKNSMDPSWHEGIMYATVQQLIEAMQLECPLFNRLYKRNVYTGSYYEKLRVSDSNEFDVNLVLQLPIPKRNIVLIANEDQRTYVTVQITGNSRKKAFFLECCDLDPHPISLFTRNGQLSRCHIQQWMNKIIGNAISSQMYWPAGVNQVSYDLNGPAFTLTIDTDCDKIFVDLVAVIDDSNLSLPYEMRDTQLNNELSDQAWQYFLIPKPIDHSPSTHCNHLCGVWRISFPEAEKEMLHDKGCVKPLIRLFKILRDCCEWKEINSFLINAVFFDRLEQYDDWEEQDIGFLFIKMLKIFSNILFRPCPFIEHYFIEDANVFGEMDSRIAKRIAKEMKSIRREVISDPENLRNYFSF